MIFSPFAELNECAIQGGRFPRASVTMNSVEGIFCFPTREAHCQNVLIPIVKGYRSMEHARSQWRSAVRSRGARASQQDVHLTGKLRAMLRSNLMIVKDDAGTPVLLPAEAQE